jgi:purine/pyrimidine-nucleoside phosphorylase
MFKVNEYFNGRVMSLGFNTSQTPATIGVISKGEYEFGTSTKEIITITSGSMDVKLPGDASWATYNQGDTFQIEKDQKFHVKAEENVSYLCLYL